MSIEKKIKTKKIIEEIYMERDKIDKKTEKGGSVTGVFTNSERPNTLNEAEVRKTLKEIEQK